MKTALISVSDKTGVVEFAGELFKLGYRLVSTGGTLKTLEEAGMKVTPISDITKFPEILDGRVKTLHPAVHAGLLALRENEEHMKILAEHKINTIDLICVNLYPFEDTISKNDCTMEDAIENIDIGGPSMLRSAAKNYKSVIVVSDPLDYKEVIENMKNGENGISEELRLRLAQKVFYHTSKYDGMIAEYLESKISDEISNELPNRIHMNLRKISNLRYGENPDQVAALYSNPFSKSGIATAELLHGKPMSYNNYIDANAAVLCVREFENPAAVCLKHTTPCGVAEAYTISEAYIKAYKADPVSVFGGIIALNRTCDLDTASEIAKIFCEIVIAPDFDDDAFEILTKKKNLRLLKFDCYRIPELREFRGISGGILVQSEDSELLDVIDCKTELKPTDEEMNDLIFAFKVVKHVKSNAIVTAKNSVTLGIGTGQVSRVWATENAISHSVQDVKGAVLASDAFFPFPDAVEKAAEAGITAIIQPGGSIKDKEVIARANELGLKMIFVGKRHFKH